MTHVEEEIGEERSVFEEREEVDPQAGEEEEREVERLKVCRWTGDVEWIG